MELFSKHEDNEFPQDVTKDSDKTSKPVNHYSIISTDKQNKTFTRSKIEGAYKDQDLQ